MQIKDNITATMGPKNVNLNGPIKMVKLRSKDNVSNNADKIMESVWTLNNLNSVDNINNEEVPKTITNETEPKDKLPEIKPIEETHEEEENTALPLTSEEVIRSKKDVFGIKAYTDIESNVVNLESYQNSRKLRVNSIVSLSANRVRNILGETRPKEDKVEVNKTFDFGSLDSINNEVNTSIKTESTGLEEPKYDNVTKLDEWLNKETAPMNNSNDDKLTDISELQAKLNDTRSSLATQKEILETLRQRVANNDVMMKQRCQEIEEENMNATRELNDVLDEITKLTSIAKEQESFLGISSDEESYGRSRAA